MDGTTPLGITALSPRVWRSLYWIVDCFDLTYWAWRLRTWNR